MLAWCLNKHSCNFLFVSPVGLDFAILRSFWVPPNSPQKGDREKCFSFVLSPLLGTVFGFIFEVFCIRFFFSSRLADVAQRLGPYMRISCQKDICTRTQLVHKSRQIKVNQKTTQGQQPRRPANPPARFAFRQKKTANQTKTGQGPNKQQPQKGFAKGHSGFTTVPLHKSLQNELSTATFRET